MERTGAVRGGRAEDESGRPISWHLGLLCAALLVPVLVLQAFLLFRVAAAERDRHEERARDSAQRIAASLDRGLTQLAVVAEVLSTSDHLLANDLTAFRGRLQQLPWLRDSGVVLRGPDGDTLLAAGAVPPGARDPAAEDLARRTGRVQFTGLLPGVAGAAPAFAIVMPVRETEGRGAGQVLVLRVPLTEIEELLTGRSVPEGMAAAIVDSAGFVLARTQDDLWPAGSRPAPLQPRPEAEGWVRGQDVDGDPAAMAFARSEVAGWTCWVVMSERHFMAPLRRSLAELLVIAAVLIGLAAILAVTFSRRLTRPISALAQAVTAGQEVAAATPVREVNALAAAYAAARKEAERLREAQTEMLHVARLNEMGVLAAELAHEINQPLTAAATFAEGALRLLPQGEASPGLGAARQAIRDAADQVLHAGSIVQRLRRFLAPSDGVRGLEDLNGLVQEAVTLVMPDARRHGITLHLVLDQQLPPVEMDRVQIGQVIVNLVRNAVEAMEQVGQRELVIATRSPEPGWTEVSVADTGPGLQPEIRERLFRPFISSKPTGMGVGLAISQSIVEGHGGRLDCTPNPGGGTVFRFGLPAQASPASMTGAIPDVG